jgi:hypothetical protein
MKSLIPLVGLVLIGAACGARTEIDGVCELPIMAEERHTRETSCEGRCVLETIDAFGRAIRLACDGTSCVLFIDNQPRCSCTDVDYAMTCARGVPTCLTGDIFSFADYSFSECET